MAYVDEEIASQPDCRRRALALAGQVADLLPALGERVAAVGCGTSWFMAMAYAGLREAAGLGETDAFAGSEFPSARRYDRIVAITRSRTTTEILNLIRATDLPVTAIVGDVEATGAAFVHTRFNGVDHEPLDPMADLILAQRFAVALARLRGLDPDHPRNLTRSVILEP